MAKRRRTAQDAEGTRLRTMKIWKCECGNQDQAKIIIALDGEVVCAECGTVLGEVSPGKSEDPEEQVEGWDGEADLCRKILEERISRKGWQF